MTNYLTTQQYRQAKARLTRAEKSGDPTLIVRVVLDTYEAWNMGGYAYPDDWHRWERALMDAEMKMAYATH